MSTRRTLELDDIFVRNLNFKDSGGFPIAPNKILFSRGDGGTFFGDLPLPCLSSVLRAFNEVRAGSNITLTSSNSYNRLWFEPGSGIDFYKLTEAGQDKIYIYATAPERLEIVGGDTISFSNIPVGPDGRTLKYAPIGDISISVSTDTVFFQTQFNSSYSLLASTLSTTLGLQDQQEILMEQQSTLGSQLQSTIDNVNILLTSTGTAALASTIESVDESMRYISTFLFRDTFLQQPSTGEYILSVSSIETQNIRSENWLVGSNVLTDTTLTPESGRNFDVYTNSGVVSTLTNYFFIEDTYSQQQYGIKKEKLYAISTVGPAVYTTYGANVETGWVPNISTLGDPFAPSLRDQFYPVLQQTQIWEQLSTSSGNVTLNYLLRNTGRFDTICAPASLYINTSSLFVSSIRTDNAYSTGILMYNPLTNEVTVNTTGQVGGGGGGTGPTGAAGGQGPTGFTGSAGPMGATGAQGIPGTATNTGATGASGDRYNTQTAYAQSINPAGGSVTLFVGTGLAYIVGNAVLVIQQTNSNNYFTGLVTSYDPVTGRIDVGDIGTVFGTFGLFEDYNVNLNGISGPTGNTGATGPTGAAGDRYATTTTTAVTLNPVLEPVTLTVATDLAYIVGNTAIIISSVNANNSFRGRVLSYNRLTGVLTLVSITAIQGSFGSSVVYNVNLDGTLGATGVTGPTGQVGVTGSTGAAGSGAAYTTFYPATAGVGSVAYGPATDQITFTQSSSAFPGFFTTQSMANGTPFSMSFTIPTFNFSQIYVGLRYQNSSYTSLLILQRSTATTGTIYWYAGSTNVGSYTVGDTLVISYNGTGFGTNIFLAKNGTEIATDAIGANTYYFEVWFNAIVAGYPQTVSFTNMRFAQGSVGATGYTGPTGLGATGVTGPTGPTGPTGYSDRFNTTSAAAVITPILGGTVSLVVDTGLAYTVGNSVAIVDSTNTANRFEGHVDSYNAGTGAITVGSIVNIQGSFGSSVVYTMNLDGVDGPTGATGPTGLGSTGPTGPAGSGGGNQIYNDAWIQYYFIDPPPSTVMQSTTSKTTEIFVPWLYPDQIPIGLTDYWIPHINIFSSFFDAQLTSGPYHVDLISSLSSQYINYHNGAGYITGFVLSKVAGTNAIESRTFPGESTARLAYVYHDTALSSIVDSSTNAVTVWYRNNNPSTYYASTPYSIFITAGPPSVPRNLTSLNPTSNTVTYTWQTPAQIDINDPTSTANLADYRIRYIQTPIPGRRYGTPVYASTLNVSLGTVSTVGLSGLYPDSYQSFTVEAKNDVAAAYGQTASTIASTTNLAQTAAISGNLSFPSRFYSNGTIRNIFTGATTTRLVNVSTAWTSDPFVSPIHSVTTRGSSTTNIATLLTSMSGALSAMGPAITYNGFPATTYGTVTTNNLTLSTFVYDKYSTPTQFTGFYLDTRDTVTVEPAAFVPSSATYTLTANQSTTNVGSLTYTYQFDNVLTAGPGISYMSTNLLSQSYTAVSGVNVLYGTPTYGVSTIVSNMGTHYYRSPLVTLTTTAGSVVTTTNETGLTNIAGGYNAVTGQFSNPLTFRSLVTSGSLAAAYASTITLSGVANNPLTASSTAFGNSITAIVDGPSATLVLSTIPSTVPALTSAVSRVGSRVYTGVAQGGISNPYVPPFLYSGGSYVGSQYASILYNHGWSITNSTISGTTPNTNEELQIFNGKFYTRGSTLSGYYDYRPFYYTNALQNTVNYSIVGNTGYRYTTFCWSVSPIVSGTTQYSALSFILNTTTPTPTITTGSAFAGGQKILLYYRFEDSSAPQPTDANNLSSIWLDGNTQGATVTSGNFFNPNDNSATRPGLIADPVNSGGNTTFTMAVPKPFQTGTGSVYLYLRVGLPMSVNFSFAYAAATMTAS